MHIRDGVERIGGGQGRRQTRKEQAQGIGRTKTKEITTPRSRLSPLALTRPPLHALEARPLPCRGYDGARRSLFLPPKSPSVHSGANSFRTCLQVALRFSSLGSPQTFNRRNVVERMSSVGTSSADSKQGCTSPSWGWFWRVCLPRANFEEQRPPECPVFLELMSPRASSQHGPPLRGCPFGDAACCAVSPPFPRREEGRVLERGSAVRGHAWKFSIGLTER